MTDDKIINFEQQLRAGQEIDLHEALRAEQAAREKAENDGRVLQLLVARIEKAIGKRVDQRILFGALIILAAKTIMYSPRAKHESMLNTFAQAVAVALQSSYPRDTYKEKHDADVKATVNDVAGVDRAANLPASPSEVDKNDQA